MKSVVTKNAKNISPILMLVLLAIIASSIGTKFISIGSVVSGKCSEIDFMIFTKIRLPRIVISIFCGALLGGTGAIFQGFFRNPLADAGIMGVSSGATFGAVLSTFLVSSLPVLKNIFEREFISPITICAFLGALLSSFFVYLFSKIFRESSSVSLLLSGTAVGTFFSAISSIVLLSNQNQMHNFYAWTMGSFNGKGWNDFFIFVIPSIVSFALLELCARHLDVLVGGEKSAMALGMNYNFVRNFILISGSIASACAVCAGGIISFVGLIAPHFVRKIFGPMHKVLIFQSMIFGGILMLVCDTFARSLIAPSEIPVGIITSLVGVPFFIFSLVRMNGGLKNKGGKVKK